MTKEHRRKILKGLAVTLPAAWSAPLVKSVVLPAHAQTSQCEAPPGCYTIGAGNNESSFSMAGRSGTFSRSLGNTVPIAPAKSREQRTSL